MLIDRGMSLNSMALMLMIVRVPALPGARRVRHTRGASLHGNCRRWATSSAMAVSMEAIRQTIRLTRTRSTLIALLSTTSVDWTSAARENQLVAAKQLEYLKKYNSIN